MNKNFKIVTEEFKEFNLPTWDSMPDIDLYMDQVVTYLDRELKSLKVNGDDKLLTTSMINNYVKGELLPSPIQKKYNKEHLSKLLIISSIKQILSISNISDLLNLYTRQNSKDLYEFFINEQKKAINLEANKLLEDINKIENKVDEDVNNEVLTYIIRLALHAEVQKILAEKLLNVITSSIVEQKESEENARIAQQKEEKEKAKQNKKKNIEEAK